MGWNSRVTGSLRVGVCLLAFAVLCAGAARGADFGLAMQESGDGAGSAIHIVHGIANAGPLDVYVDGAIALIGIKFGESSGSLALEPGEHAFVVVPSGAAPDAAIVDGPISLQDGERYYAALLGTAEEASVGLYAIDDRPIDAGSARFRIISGVAGAGEIVPAFSGGDALSEPLAFGDASQYATIDAGVYDLEILDAVSGGPLLSLPQTPFAEGAATDVILFGQLSDGTLQALIVPTSLETTPIEGMVARVFSGECATLGPLVADLGVVQEGQGASVGVQETPPVAQGFGLAPVSFAALTATPHVVAISDTADEEAASLACGEIGGQLTDTGSLVIALEASFSGGPGGIAVLAPALENPEATGISIFLTGSAAGEATNDAEPVSEEAAD